MEKNHRTFICCTFIEHMKIVYPDNSIAYVFICVVSSNVQLGGNVFKSHDSNFIVMEKIPIVNQIIQSQKAI